MVEVGAIEPLFGVGDHRAKLHRLAKIALAAIRWTCPDNSNDAIAAQFHNFVRRDTEALQDFCGVLTEVGYMRRELIVA